MLTNFPETLSIFNTYCLSIPIKASLHVLIIVRYICHSWGFIDFSFTNTQHSLYREKINVLGKYCAFFLKYIWWLILEEKFEYIFELFSRGLPILKRVLIWILIRNKLGWKCHTRDLSCACQTISGHLQDTFQTPFKHLPDTFQTLSKHLPDTPQTPFIHPKDTSDSE